MPATTLNIVLNIVLNGVSRSATVPDPSEPLLYVLREQSTAWATARAGTQRPRVPRPDVGIRSACGRAKRLSPTPSKRKQQQRVVVRLRRVPSSTAAAA